MPPTVSICLPNLNNRAYLGERLGTIRAQTLSDWELVVSDNFSDDGAWEFLREEAARDPRILLAQAPREGMYANWNRCLSRARGEYVYIATSDDTMTPDCLAELVAALEGHPECDIAQCCLHAIDDEGKVMAGWWKLVGAARFLGDDYLRPHLRRAPYDGVLHCAMHTIYHSITQVLIRRSAFAKTGPFPTGYGSGGDFCWGMRAGLNCDVVHVPKFLATWRIHTSQASAGYAETAAERALMAGMVDAALASVPPGSPASRLPTGPLRFPYRYGRHRLEFAGARTPFRRLVALAGLVFGDPRVAIGAARLVLAGQRRTFDKAAYVRGLLRRFHLEDHFVRLGPPDAAPTVP